VEDIGWCWFFGVIDHFNDELISWHTCDYSGVNVPFASV
jgi:hypothetical protein